MSELILEEDCTDCKATGILSNRNYMVCPYCKRGKVPSELGQKILDLVSKFALPINKVNKNDRR